MTAKIDPKPCGNPECSISTGFHEGLTFGSGDVDEYGFWQTPCEVCARGWEKTHPSDAPCWPFASGLTRPNEVSYYGFSYYWRGNNETDEIAIQLVDSNANLSIRVSEEGGESSMVKINADEVDRMILGLQAARKKMNG